MFDITQSAKKLALSAALLVLPAAASAQAPYFGVSSNVQTPGVPGGFSNYSNGLSLDNYEYRESDPAGGYWGTASNTALRRRRRPRLGPARRAAGQDRRHRRPPGGARDSQQLALRLCRGALLGYRHGAFRHAAGRHSGHAGFPQRPRDLEPLRYRQLQRHLLRHPHHRRPFLRPADILQQPRHGLHRQPRRHHGQHQGRRPSSPGAAGST